MAYSSSVKIPVAKRKQRRDDAELEEVLKRYRNDSTEEEEVYGSEEKKPHFVPVICEGVQHFAPSWFQFLFETFKMHINEFS